MAPSKKSKSVNRVIVSANESSPSKDDKSKQKKRKLTDMLGPQWSKHEIERFYDAYRKHDQDWKMVASVVCSRSIGMVEALYNMNRAYLSLPEGTASVAGLIAMMTDHYNVLEGSGSEKDSEGPEVTARKIHKNSKTKSVADFSRDYIKRQSGSSDGCLSLLKSCGDGIQPHFPVRKRTPRVPVSCLDNNSIRKPRISGVNADDEGIPHGGSMLRKEWKNPNSPLGLQAAYTKFEDIRITQVSAKGQETSPFRGLKIKNGGYAADEEFKEGSLGCNVYSNGIMAKESMDSGKSALAGYKKRKKGKREGVQHSEATLLNNIRGAYNYDDKGARRNCFDDKGVKIYISTSEGQRKKSKKLTHEDELAACDALQALAEMSSMMPFLDAEHVENAGESIVDRVAHSDIALSDEKVTGESQKKITKAQKAESPYCSRKSAETESMADDEVKSADSNGHMSAMYKRCSSSLRSPDLSSSNDPHAGETEFAVSSAQHHSANQLVNLRRRNNKRKREKTLLVKDRNNALSGLTDGLSVLQDNLQDVKGKLSHCLSWHEVRRWCMYEWFYSAIDYPWFAKREFEEYLNHVGLGHIPRLTRFELGVIRSSLGRPRRFSEHFLQVEREKLKHYRESVRSHYASFRAGHGGLPADLACPLYVGQQVVAIHPKTRECHNGSVLTVDGDNCRVQFNHPDLGVELVTDLDCMPLNPLEKIPEAMRRQKRPFDYRYVQVPKVNEAINPALVEHMKNDDHNLCVPPISPSSSNDIKVEPACLSVHTKAVVNGSFSTQSAIQNPSRNIGQMHPQEAYMSLVPGLTGDLDRKVIDQHITDQETLPSRLLPIKESVGLKGTMHSSTNSSLSCQESASNVAEIVEASRDKAQRMVDTTIKVMSVMKEDEDVFGRISEALDANCKAECASSGWSSMTKNSNTVGASLPPQTAVTSSVPMLASDGKSDLEIPSDLITSCVATLLMIQTCTERQYPPAEVAQILDNAATSLHPCCPRNLTIYREIEMCMGRIKTQILALVPT